MFDRHTTEEFMKPVSKEELLDVLKSFAKDKSRGSDGWPTEFYIAFFDLFGDELLEMIELTRVKGHIPGAIGASFITLIPKSSNPATFSDYRPIALCNVLYKMSSKVIANKLKPTLSKWISDEQYGFLNGRSIHDAMAIAQEAMHTIHE